MQNPKRASNRYEIESRACYLTNRRIDEKRNESRNHWIGNARLGFGETMLRWIGRGSAARVPVGLWMRR